MLALISHHYANITWVDILQGLSYFASEAIYHFPFSSLPIVHNSLLRDGSFEAALDTTQAEGKTMLHMSQLLQHGMQVKCTICHSHFLLIKLTVSLL
jgi:hypothetical protein